VRALILAVFLVATPVAAREIQPLGPGRWGFGLTLGDPFGLSLKHYLRAGNAWDLYMAFAYGPGFRFGGDWLWTLGTVVRERKFEVNTYAGVGPFIGAFSGPCGVRFGIYSNCGSGSAFFGARVPLGLELLLREAPLSLGLEVGPGIAFYSGGADFLFDFLLAIRYLF